MARHTDELEVFGPEPHFGAGQAAARDILTRIVRLEHRLERAGVLPLEYDEHGLRFVLENGLPIELETENAEPRQISIEFVDAVSSWLEAHESDEDASLARLEADVIGNDIAGRTDIRTVLAYFAQSRPAQWEAVISRMADRDSFALGRIKKLFRDE